jgi:hypothetical protein
MRQVAVFLLFVVPLACSSSSGDAGPAAAPGLSAADGGAPSGDGGVAHPAADGGSSAPGTSGGGGPDGAADGASPPPSTPTQILADAECTRMMACLPKDLKTTFGDLATCRARTAIWDDYEHSALDYQVIDRAGAMACAAALGAVSCSDYLMGVGLDACKWKGARPNDTAKCDLDGQCHSGFCSGTGCGLCRAAPPGVGDSCQGSATCAPGLACTKGVCTPRLAQGASCTVADDCVATLFCVAGKCTALPATVGAPCGLDLNCDFYKELYCDVPSGSTTGVCKSFQYGVTGQPCDRTGRFCLGARCNAIGQAAGECIPTAADGAQCASNCMFPAGCIGGVCTPPSLSSFTCN